MRDNKELIERFDLYASLPTRKRIDKMSEGNYIRSKRYLERFLNFESSTENIRDRFIEWLMSQDLAESSRATISFSIGSFLRYCNLISEDDFNVLKKHFRHPISVWSSKKITYNDIVNLINQHLALDNPLSRSRNPLIIIFFATVGLRVSQLINILSDEVREDKQENRLIVLFPKAKENRQTLIPQKDIKYIPFDLKIGSYTIKEYYDNYIFAKKYFVKNQNSSNDSFFVTKSGNKLTDNYIRKEIIQKYNPSLTTHSFRHFVATNIANKQGIHKASIMLGHQSISTTMRYVNPETVDTIKMIKEIYAELTNGEED